MSQISQVLSVREPTCMCGCQLLVYCKNVNEIKRTILDSLKETI